MSRVIDRTRKADDYLLGGARAYLLHDGSSAARDVGLQVDVPGLAPVEEPTLDLRVPREGAWVTVATGAEVELELAGRTVALHA